MTLPKPPNITFKEYGEAMKTMNKKEQWEEEWDNKFGSCNNDFCPDWLLCDWNGEQNNGGICDHDDGIFCNHRERLAKQFIKSLLAEKDKEILDTLEEISRPENSAHYSHCEYCGEYEDKIKELKSNLTNK